MKSLKLHSIKFFNFLLKYKLTYSKVNNAFLVLAKMIHTALKISLESFEELCKKKRKNIKHGNRDEARDITTL